MSASETSIQASASSRLHTYREAIASTIRTAMPALRQVESIGSRFSVAELMKRSIRAPAAFVVLLRAPLSRQPNAQLQANAKVAVFCVTTGREDERESHAFTIAEAVAVLAETRQVWGLDRIGPANNMEIEQVLSDALDNKGVACVVAQFEQRVSGIGRDLLGEDGIVDAALYFREDGDA
ncbi:MAG: hypothetical protein H2045_13030 [Rhizobiales bacterium]|nr:hypothetical protein [Hyphomicrobiales bacterium]